MGFMDWLHKVYQMEKTPTQQAYANDNKRLNNMMQISGGDPDSGLMDWQFLHRVANERGYQDSASNSGFAYIPRDSNELAVARSLDKTGYRADNGELSPADILRLETTPQWRQGKRK